MARMRVSSARHLKTVVGVKGPVIAISAIALLLYIRNREYMIFRIYSKAKISVLLILGLRPQACILLPDLRRHDIAEILHLVHRPDIDIRVFEHGIGATLDPFDRLVHVLHFPDPVTGDDLLRLREWPVDHRPVLAGKVHALRL